MKPRTACILSLMILIACGLAVTSCSTGPSAAKPGTPAFYWGAARETFAAGDYLKTIEHLEGVCRTENEFTARARPWLLIMTSGMARGYMHLSDTFELGTRANRVNPTPFRRYMLDFRTYASRLSLQFATAFEAFEKNSTDAKVSLAFQYPTGSPFSSPQLAKIGNGELLQPAVVDDVRRSELRHAVLMETCRAAGFRDDTAKTSELFKAGNVQVAREVFMLEMASNLHDQAQLFVRTKLDQPDRLKMFSSHAADVVKALPETKETKALNTKIQKTLKLAASTK